MIVFQRQPKNRDITTGKFRSGIADLRDVVLRLSLATVATQSACGICRRIIASRLSLHDNFSLEDHALPPSECFCSVETGVACPGSLLR